ncbi:hypothetical protein QFC22_002103 [Naganishia vaughanmartiniae]|uniref:Uncharacterized protein n=1 Tax=Naganishia vaughanmartiniae TaxID=1424756 RepID=A0ACC2XFK1_9TREE|nr:hypothetical protein QFC22_002103 [Naganishia vaughanmartiniae]
MQDTRQRFEFLERHKLDKVIEQGERLSKGSWELTTQLQARLELDNPELTPFAAGKGLHLLSLSRCNLPKHLIDLAESTLRARPTAVEFPTGKGQVLCRDDAAGDPASLGIACLIYALAEDNDVEKGRMKEDEKLTVKGVSMMQAVEAEIEFLDKSAYRTHDGAISHRLGHVSLWADFVYMVPPFYAFYGLTQSSDDAQIRYFQKAYDQCRLYRDHLRRADGLWKHIIMGPDKIDPWPWATSNGWAAAGMLRVLAMMGKANEQVQNQLQSQMTDLGNWAREIVEATAKRVTDAGMVKEYIDEPDFEGESCGTALLAYAAYRLAHLNVTSEFIPFAERARQEVSNLIKPDGLLDKVCDIVDERKWRESSAEGQAFVVLLEAAARDYWKAKERSVK